MKNNFFLKTRTHKVITWQGKIIILASMLVFIWLCWPLLRIAVTNYICYDDELHPVSRIIVENWDGDIDIFEGSAKVASSIGATEIFSIIFEDAYRDARKRKAYLLNAWAAGIDTARFSLIPVPKRDPKTLNIARTVLDTAHQRLWTELTIVTFALHSARSRKAYLLAAKPYTISIRIAGVALEEVTSQNWPTTSSGLATAFSETIKKMYYDLVVF
jgi:UDP-N-acetylmuramyl pentapeptide phosphotransferase/UDP-N-acetylglucosamine-1-phosphate transferase